MSHTRLPSDLAMRKLRDLGVLVCRCLTPVPVLLPLWKDYQCDHCGKAVVW